MDIRRVGIEIGLRDMVWIRDEIPESITRHIDRSPKIDIRSNQIGGLYKFHPIEFEKCSQGSRRDRAR